MDAGDCVATGSDPRPSAVENAIDCPVHHRIRRRTLILGPARRLTHVGARRIKMSEARRHGNSLPCATAYIEDALVPKAVPVLHKHYDLSRL